ncbi:thermonuclease family protein [Planctomycetes bacterium Poly30]
MHRIPGTALSLLLLGLAGASAPAGPSPQERPPQAAPTALLADCMVEKPTELFPVAWVVDGDTIHVDRDGKREKLRLLSIDTEEKYMPKNDSETKPSTRFGDLTAGWAQGFFMPRSPSEGAVEVGLRFPGGVEARDPYGRLLCHVVTSEGVDFNLLMVRTGLSPYFNKYGNSRIDHERFVAAQKAAMAEQRGIWDPRTNDGGSRRPYDRLLPWWDARAEAVNAHRALAASDPMRFLAADEPDQLSAAIAKGPREVTVLALIDRFFEEDDGSRTVLLRGGDKRRSVRVSIPKELRGAMEKLDLDHSYEDFRQNYFLIDGTLQMGARGFDLVGVGVEDWRLAGPEPAIPGRAPSSPADLVRRR